jgi:hypothetical protein
VNIFFLIEVRCPYCYVVDIWHLIEYAMHGQFLVKADVFSFSILVLEIISGTKNIGIRDEENREHLSSFCKSCVCKVATECLFMY